MDPELRLYAAAARVSPAAERLVRALIAWADSLAARVPAAVCFSADDAGEFAGLELPGPRQRARIVRIHPADRRVGLDLSAEWLPPGPCAALRSELGDGLALDGVRDDDAPRIVAALERFAAAVLAPTPDPRWSR